jgi:gliding motility-associated-like protein
VIPPNVITANNDQINDLLEFKYLEFYPNNSLVILNRWGNVIYDNEKYLNDWNGKDMSGKDIEDGVYFYTVVAQSEKFIYDDAKKSQFLLSGFFHVFH